MIRKSYQDSATIAIDDEHHDDDADDLNEGDERGLEALAEPGVGRQEDVGEVRNNGRVAINLCRKIGDLAIFGSDVGMVLLGFSISPAV